MKKPFTQCSDILNLIGDFAGARSKYRNGECYDLVLRFPLTKKGNFNRYLHIVDKSNPRKERPRALTQRDWIPIFAKKPISLELVELAYRFINYYTEDFCTEQLCFPRFHSDDFNNELRILVEKYYYHEAINYGLTAGYPSSIPYVPEKKRADHKKLYPNDYHFRSALRQLHMS